MSSWKPGPFLRLVGAGTGKPDCEAYTEDASMHGFPANVPPTVEGIRALFGGMWAAFPDIRVEIEHLGVEDDVAALHVRVRGTHEGEFMGAAPTGNRIDVEVMTFLRFGPQVARQAGLGRPRPAVLRQPLGRLVRRTAGSLSVDLPPQRSRAP
jgi:predicted ester cyclase